jgi:SAM-dependent methyltransferase
MENLSAPGDHLEYVGPREEYDLMGAMQFSVMCTLGLRHGHRLLDIGCGSLRAGRLFIPYLHPGGYTGLEPNRWLVEDAIEKDLGQELMTLRTPTFVYNETFDVSGLDPFDFVIAQSIASHTGPAMTKALIASVRDALAPSGLAAVTFVHGPRDTAKEGWEYQGITPYRRQTIARWLLEAELDAVPLRWYHPRQTWWAITHRGTPLPPRHLRLRARGAVLAYPRSWDLAKRVRYSPLLRTPRHLLRRVSGRGHAAAS